MATEQSPAFQFYVKEWRSSRAVQRMSFGERGIYFEMLCEQWEALTLPDSAEEVAALIATTEAQVAEIVASWPTLRRKFATVEGQAGRIANLRLERVRKEKKAFIRMSRKGGKSRADQADRDARGAFQPTPSQTPAVSQPPASQPPAVPPAESPGVASASSSSSTATATPSPSATATAERRRSAGQPPLSLGLRRLKIWRWMIEEFIGKLGEHADGFDLDAWIQEQDRTEVRVISGDWGAYWATAFDAEIRRRGLPMATTSDRKPIFSQSSQEMGEAVLANLKRDPGLPR